MSNNTLEKPRIPFREGINLRLEKRKEEVARLEEILNLINSSKEAERVVELLTLQGENE